jgi:hypothetical protein
VRKTFSFKTAQKWGKRVLIQGSITGTPTVSRLEKGEAVPKRERILEQTPL